MTFFQRARQDRLQSLADGSRVIDTPCGPIEFSDHGDGLPTLVLHGILGHYEHGYNYAAPLLDWDTRVITPSRLGYLNTPAGHGDDLLTRQTAQLAALLDALELEQVAVIALSGAGPVGMAFARRYPQRCTSLTLISAITVQLSTFRRLVLQAANWALQHLPFADTLVWLATRLIVATLPYWSLLKPRFRQQIVADPHNRKLYEEVVRDFFPMVALRDGFARDLQVYAQLDAEAPAPIPVPTLLIHSCESLVLPRHHALAVEQTTPPTDTLYLEDAGHAMHISHADTVWQHVQDFCHRHHT